YARFASRHLFEFGAKVLSAMRKQFGRPRRKVRLATQLERACPQARHSPCAGRQHLMTAARKDAITLEAN
ncbi:hypothetical protein, partial [Mycobacterium kyorinense]|uniref:hypothetical protein n=1 Tax=Mycobacterium kyorinense TaxID=487514 RepID=UPI0005EEED82